MRRRRPITTTLVKLSVLSVFLVFATGLVPNRAYAGNPTANQLWSGLTGQQVIAVPNGSKGNGEPLITWPSNGHLDQLWSFDYTNYEFQAIVNVNSGLCMGVSGESKAAGAAIIQWSCNGNPDQEWALGGPDGAYGYDTLINENSGMCIGISGENRNEGANLIQWPCNGNADQQWIPDSAPWPSGDDGGDHWFACMISNGKCSGNQSDTDPINIIFNDPNGNALTDITNALKGEGWLNNTCYNIDVVFDATNTGRDLQAPSAVLATNFSGCGNFGQTRDHIRLWPTPDSHTVFGAASTEQVVNCPPCHTVLSYNDGRTDVISALNNYLSGRMNFISNEAMQYGAGNIGGVGFDGYAGIFDIGA